MHIYTHIHHTVILSKKENSSLLSRLQPQMSQSLFLKLLMAWLSIYIQILAIKRHLTLHHYGPNNPCSFGITQTAPNKSLCSASFLCIPRVDTQPWERGVKYSIVLPPPLLAVGFSTSVLSHTERLQLQFWSEEVWRRRCPAGTGQRDKQSQGDDSKRAQKSSREKLEGHWTASTKAVVWREITSELCKVFSLSTGRLQRRAAAQPVTLERKSVSGKF